MQQSLGFAHFLAQADGVARAILVIMLLMSLTTWYLIIAKSLRNILIRRESARFLKEFWQARDLDAVARGLAAAPPQEPFGLLLQRGLRAIEQHRTRGATRLAESGGADEYLTRALRRAIDEAAARAESGLTVLASVGSSAPFIGLFGTVWGIYHALIAIGLSGQGTLDKVAGPVGEALIMTALGLAVAIPAVLAYNAFTRHNRVVAAELDGFAHDVYAFMSTGHRDENGGQAGDRQAAGAARQVPAAATKGA
ncbi:MAG: MotA/TolQ/ExbB proton channel family protein [Burkholderiales bacterium]|nr:MotA/TolQ/ExbB proton channel family protein [Burkholderiales bacterium]